MKPSRRRSRELVLQGLYQWIYTGASAADVLKNLAELETFPSADREFLEEELRGVMGSAQDLIARTEPFTGRKWKEVSPVEQAILLLAGWELAHRPEIPYRVTINEAIELGKRFCATDGHKYVNGVLDRLAQETRPDEFGASRPAQAPRKRRNA